MGAFVSYKTTLCAPHTIECRMYLTAPCDADEGCRCKSFDAIPFSRKRLKKTVFERINFVESIWIWAGSIMSPSHRIIHVSKKIHVIIKIRQLHAAHNFLPFDWRTSHENSIRIQAAWISLNVFCLCFYPPYILRFVHCMWFRFRWKLNPFQRRTSSFQLDQYVSLDKIIINTFPHIFNVSVFCFFLYRPRSPGTHW